MSETREAPAEHMLAGVQCPKHQPPGGPMAFLLPSTTVYTINSLLVCIVTYHIYGLQLQAKRSMQVH